jgi:RNA polymerase sigma-70 factor (ECF subfamily)
MADDSGHTTRLQRCLDRLRSGDDSARGELLAHAGERLGRLTRKLLRANPRVRRWEETDDVRQNALLRLYRALEQVRPATVRDFFRLAALHIRRELIDLARHYYGPEGMGRHQVTDRPSDSGTDHPPSAHERADTTHEPNRLAAWTEMHEHIEKLEDEEREVFDLLWYHALPQAEAAAVLKVSERTLQRRWRTARRRLHQAMEGEPPDA